MTNDNNDLTNNNLGNNQANLNHNEPIRNPILSQSVNNMSQPNNINQVNNNAEPTLPGMENLTQSNIQNANQSNFNTTKQNEINGNNINQPLPEMQNFSNQTNIDNNGQSVFLDQQGFDQMNFNDQNNVYNNRMFEANNFNQNQNDIYGQNQYNSNIQNFENTQNQFEQEGTNYNVNSNSQYNQDNEYVQSQSNSSDYNLAFVQNWMGKIYEKAHSKKFNWCAALFGEIYLLYRKVYVTGMLLLILTMLLSICASITGNQILNIVLIAYAIIKFFALGFGFYPMYRSNVRKELNKYKNEIQDNNQLIEKARKNGGVSIVALVVCIIIELIVSGICTSMVLKSPGANARNDAGNQINEASSKNTQEVFFEQGYVIDYDANKWIYTPQNSTFTDGNYKLEYKVKYDQSQFGVDFSTPEGRGLILTMLTNSFNAQAAQSNLQAEVANSSFIAKYTSYYAYIDIISTTTISRYYFVILPEEKVMFQFVLEANDTAIDYSTNLDIIDMLGLIMPMNETQNTTNVDSDSNTINNSNAVTNNTQNDVSNSIYSSGNLTSSGNEIISYTTNETDTQNTGISNDVQSALSNSNVQNANYTSSNQGSTSSSSQMGGTTQVSNSSSLSSLVQ